VSFRSVNPLASVDGPAAGERGGRVPSPPKYVSIASGAVRSACIAISAGDNVVGGGVPFKKAERRSTRGASVGKSTKPSVMGATISSAPLGSGVGVDARSD
jgi:hypothetical protein